MHPNILQLIEMAIADGEVTDKERAIIFRKSEILGEDHDEVEMILDGQIALKRKEQSSAPNSQTMRMNKEGDLRKCPSCGAPAVSFATMCEHCNHEFRNIETAKSIKKLSERISEIEEIVRNSQDPRFKLEHLVQEEIDNRLMIFLQYLPVPNTKEDILEFLSLAVPETKKKIGWWQKNIAQHPIRLQRAWLSKAEQIIIKARFSMKDDKKTLEEINYYARQLGF